MAHGGARAPPSPPLHSPPAMGEEPPVLLACLMACQEQTAVLAHSQLSLSGKLARLARLGLSWPAHRSKTPGWGLWSPAEARYSLRWLRRVSGRWRGGHGGLPPPGLPVGCVGVGGGGGPAPSVERCCSALSSPPPLPHRAPPSAVFLLRAPVFSSTTT